MTEWDNLIHLQKFGVHLVHFKVQKNRRQSETSKKVLGLTVQLTLQYIVSIVSKP